jgi:hypothetical protein
MLKKIGTPRAGEPRSGRSGKASAHGAVEERWSERATALEEVGL